QRSQSPGSPPIFDWELHLLQAPAIHVAPQRNARSVIMGERHIHPAILVEVQSDGCRDWRQLGRIPGLGRAPFTFARIQKQLRLGSSKNQVNRPIVIEISRSYAEGRRVAGKT